jgi:hypothetical protein
MSKTFTIKVTWKAFEKSLGIGESVASVTVSYKADEDTDDIEICERVFQDTNKYQGSFWDLVEPLLPENRTHTALSVGDEVEVNGIIYRCEGAGWQPLAVSQ